MEQARVLRSATTISGRVCVCRCVSVRFTEAYYEKTDWLQRGSEVVRGGLSGASTYHRLQVNGITSIAAERSVIFVIQSATLNSPTNRKKLTKTTQT